MSLNTLILLRDILLSQKVSLHVSDEEIEAVLTARRELAEAIAKHPDVPKS